MTTLRTLFFALLLALSGAHASAATLSPLYQFVDVPVNQPATPQRVKAAIVNAALLQVWTIVENPDGSLTASMWKIGEYDFKVRITYAADRFSLVYLDSKGLNATTGYEQTLKQDYEIARHQSGEEKIANAIKALPEAGAAVKTAFHMHPAPNTWLRELLGGIRRELAAPAY
jgi:hypothetical protein